MVPVKHIRYSNVSNVVTNVVEAYLQTPRPCFLTAVDSPPGASADTSEDYSKYSAGALQPSEVQYICPASWCY